MGQLKNQLQALTGRRLEMNKKAADEAEIKRAHAIIRGLPAKMKKLAGSGKAQCLVTDLRIGTDVQHVTGLAFNEPLIEHDKYGIGLNELIAYLTAEGLECRFVYYDGDEDYSSSVSLIAYW